MPSNIIEAVAERLKEMTRTTFRVWLISGEGFDGRAHWLDPEKDDIDGLTEAVMQGAAHGRFMRLDTDKGPVTIHCAAVIAIRNLTDD